MILVCQENFIPLRQTIKADTRNMRKIGLMMV